jgi:hypothetical protein
MGRPRIYTDEQKKAKKKEYNHRYYLAHQTELKEYNRRYYLAHQAELRAKHLTYSRARSRAALLRMIEEMHIKLRKHPVADCPYCQAVSQILGTD